MNLAEIRKKAREGKTVETKPVEPSPAPLPSTGAMPVETNDGAASLPEDGALTGAERRDASTVPADGRPPEKPPEPFDPIGVLLAGRQSAGSASEAGEATDTAGDGDDLRKYLRFRVADEEYGVSLLEIREIIKPRDITEVPRMPAFVAGVLSLRGTIIPVFDLRLRLGLPVTESAATRRIIIARKGEGACGLLVDEVFQVIGLADSSLEHAPAVLEGIDREFVKGIGRYGERMLILLDLEMIMDVSLR
jgi:purine-binding chemotaxis protein CheW